MPVLRTPLTQNQRIAPVRKSLLRRFAGVMAALSLMLQMLAPSLASASQGDWIEICSEYGTVLMQVDLSDETSPPGTGHADCEDCTFCALAAPMNPPAGTETDLADASTGKAVRWVEYIAEAVERHRWPESRGPPVRATFEIAVRGPRASTAFTIYQGGAL